MPSNLQELYDRENTLIEDTIDGHYRRRLEVWVKGLDTIISWPIEATLPKKRES